MKKYNILTFNPIIAKEIGINESIILQQLNYWHSKYSFQKWIYNSYEQWQKQFYFWSERTIRRIFNSLEQRGLVLSKRSKDYKLYRLSENAIKKFFTNQDSPSCPSRVAKLDISYNKETKNTQKISSYKENIKKNKDYSKQHIINTEILDMNYSKKIQVNVQEMIEIWNNVFEFSLKPIQAFLNKEITWQLANILKNKFNNNLSEWRMYAKKINSSKFLMGEKETKNNFKAEFTWLIKEDVIDSIQNGAYGVGDRPLDSERLEENLKICEKDVKQEFKAKMAKYLEEGIAVETEEQEFKKYIMSREYENDGDKYAVKKHMESIGKYYVYGGYITPSHVFYPGNEKYRKRLFNSFLMQKYCGIDETMIDSEIKVSVTSDIDRGVLFKSMKAIKNKISNFDSLFYQKIDQSRNLLGFRKCFKEIHV
jgi:hypothetical protein